MHIIHQHPAIHLLIALVIMPKQLQARGTYYVNVEKLGHGAHWRRTYGQQVYSPFLLAFTNEVHLVTISTYLINIFSFLSKFTVCLLILQEETSWKSYNVPKSSMMDANYSLPHNVAIVTLQVSLYSPFFHPLPTNCIADIHSSTNHILTFQSLDDGTTLLRLAHLFQVC
jgi:alpha-mannosidase